MPLLRQKDDNIKQAIQHNIYLTLINIHIYISDINIATDEVNGKSNTFIIKLQSGYTNRLCGDPVVITAGILVVCRQRTG